jgi:hypothetical protein
MSSLRDFLATQTGSPATLQPKAERCRIELCTPVFQVRAKQVLPTNRVAHRGKYTPITALFYQNKTQRLSCTAIGRRRLE